MTELEKLARAKMYMDKLANGINPIDDTEIPDGDTVNNVRLSRCFFYVADVLGQVINAGGVQPQSVKKGKKAPFSLSPEQAEAFEFSNSPITATEISKRIESLIDTDVMSKLSGNKILMWLESIGAVEKYESGDRSYRRATEAGASLGITSETRRSFNGNEYHVVLCNREAQALILDNTDAITENANAEKAERKANKGTPWTQEQDNALIDLFKSGATVREMSYAMQRTGGGIRARLEKLGLTGDNK